MYQRISDDALKKNERLEKSRKRKSGEKTQLNNKQTNETVAWTS